MFSICYLNHIVKKLPITVEIYMAAGLSNSTRKSTYKVALSDQMALLIALVN